MIAQSTQSSVPCNCLQLMAPLITLILLPYVKPSPVSNAAVYNSCSAQTFPLSSSESYRQTLSSLYAHLIAQSTQTKFFKSIEIGSDDSALSGLFQCRGDISEEDCYNCVNMLPELSNSLCGYSMAAQIQLHGCYARYEADGFSLSDITEDPPSGSRLNHKICGQPMELSASANLREQMDAAFVDLENGVIGGNGFYSTNYGSVQVMGQCEGDVEACDCGICISEAVQIAQRECVDSVSGEIYLDRCFITYNCSPNSRPGGRNNDSNRGRSTAIIVGGAAAIALILVFFLSIKSRCEKDGD